MAGIVSLTCLVGVAPAASAQVATPNTVTPPVISTFAGTGQFGYSGDGGPATSARLNFPTGMAEDVAGNIYMADTVNNRIRRVAAGGNITTVAGNGTPGFSGDGGPAKNARLFAPTGVAVDTAGNLYIADTGNNRVRKVNSAGTITTIAGNGGLCLGLGFGGLGSAISATLCLAQSLVQTILQLVLGLLGIHLPPNFTIPTGIAVDHSGNVYVADAGNNVIRKITPSGTISTFAGTGHGGNSGDGGPANKAQLSIPTGVSVDSLGNVYIADTANNKIRKVNAAGIISTFAGVGGLPGYGGDGGLATLGHLSLPTGTGIDPLGNIYITDTLNCRIRVVIPKGDILTYGGNGSCGYSGDGGPATLARINLPIGSIAVDANNIYFGDTLNSRGRRIQGGPPPNIPEVPFALVLPLCVLALLGGGYVLSRRRQQRGLAAPPA